MVETIKIPLKNLDNINFIIMNIKLFNSSGPVQWPVPWQCAGYFFPVRQPVSVRPMLSSRVTVNFKLNRNQYPKQLSD